MSFFSFIPAPALIFLVILLVIIIVSVILLVKRKKPASEGKPATPQQGMPATQPELETQTMNISPQPVKINESKYVALIAVAAILAVLIPLAAVVIVRNQPPLLTQTATQTPQTASCNAITLTDTLGTVLSESDLVMLRPGDEVKIIISAAGGNLTKARFRVNGSGWQEVTNKDGNNFIGNYILDAQNKFNIEAEVFDKEKGWL